MARKEFQIGQRVRIADSAHPSHGRVGMYDGEIATEPPVLRIRMAVYSPVTQAWTNSGCIVAQCRQVSAA